MIPGGHWIVNSISFACQSGVISYVVFLLAKVLSGAAQSIYSKALLNSPVTVLFNGST